MSKCWICQKELEVPLLEKKKDKWMISGVHLFHYYDTHGIPYDYAAGSVNKALEIYANYIKEIGDQMKVLFGVENEKPNN